MPDKLKKTSPAPKNKKGKSLAVKLGFKSSSSKKNGLKEKSSKRPVRTKPGFVLYSSEGEDQVAVMNNDIDKCTNILNQLIATKQEKREDSPNLSRKKSIKKSIDEEQIERKITAPPTAIQAYQEKLELTKRTLVQEVVTDVKTPFNNRLISSTPDPDKISEENVVPLKISKEQANRPVHMAPITMTQRFLSAQDVMRPIVEAHSSQGQNYVHIHKITDPSRVRHNVVNGNKDGAMTKTNTVNSRPEYVVPPQRSVNMLKPGKRCYSNDELTYGQRGNESPLDLSSQKTSETLSKTRPLSTDSIMDLRKKNLITFSTEESSLNSVEDHQDNAHIEAPLYEDDNEIFSTPALLKPTNKKQSRKCLDGMYDGDGEKKKDWNCSSKNDDKSFGFHSLDSYHSSLASPPDTRSLLPDFQENLKLFQKAAQNSMSQLHPGTGQSENQRTSPIESNTSNPSSLKNKKHISVDLCSTPMPSPVRMSEPRARAILGRPHHAVSPESDRHGDTQAKTSPTQSSPPRKVYENSDQASPPRHTVHFATQVSPPRDGMIKVNLHGDLEWRYKDTQPASQPMITPAKYQKDVEVEEEPYINVVDYPKEEEAEEPVEVERHVFSDLPPHFARLAHLSETPANSPIRFPRPRSHSSSRLTVAGTIEATTNQASKKSDHPFLRTILSESERDMAQQEGTKGNGVFESDPFPQQSTSFPSKPLSALPNHLVYGTPMNSPVRPMFNGRSEGQGVQEAEERVDNDQAIPTTNDPVASVKKLRWLLTELLEVCDIDGDPDMCQLAQDLSNTVESIPQLKITFNLQSEIDLALQPLRSENSQLRRRLRIVNQQLKERERLEKEAAPTSGVNFQVLHLQSSNNTLQRQLKEEKETRSKLSQRVMELEREKENSKQERQQLVLALGEKDNDRLKLRQENSQENQKLRQDLALAKTRTEGSSLKLEASDRENHILKISLKQRDAEIERLQEVVQTLKEGVNEVMSCIEKKPTNGRKIEEKPGTGYGLGKLLDFVQQDQVSSSPDKSIHSDPGSVSMLRSSSVLQHRFTDTDSSLTQLAVAEHNRILKKTGQSTTPKTTHGYREGPTSKKMDKNANFKENVEFTKGSNETSRYSGTDYFKKYPTQKTVGETNPRLSIDSTSTTEDVDKGEQLDISLSTIQEDVQSVISSITESSSSSAVDDTAFREGIANLDANIAKVQEALQRTKKIFS